MKVPTREVTRPRVAELPPIRMQVHGHVPASGCVVSDVDWRVVCAHFGLGVPRRPPQPVDGAASNKVRRVVTDGGEYAIKHLTNNADQPRFLPNLETACQIEYQALAAGVRMPEPVPDPHTGSYLVRLGGAFIRVHRWLDGHTPTRADTDVPLAAAAARQRRQPGC